MDNPRENKDCYAEETQRAVLLELLGESTVEDRFFLTGGTALSVFYLHHRDTALQVAHSAKPCGRR